MSCTFTIILDNREEIFHWIDQEPDENEIRFGSRCLAMAENLAEWFIPSIWGEAEPFKTIFG